MVYLSVAHNYHLVPEGHGFHLVVGDINHRPLDLLVHLFEFQPYVGP